MWASILTVALQVLSWVLNRAEVSKEIKENFFKWVKEAGNDLGSAKLMKYGDEQLEWLKTHPWEES